MLSTYGTGIKLSQLGAVHKMEDNTDAKVCLKSTNMSHDILFPTLPLAIPGIVYVSAVLVAFTCGRRSQQLNDRKSDNETSMDNRRFRIMAAGFLLFMAMWTLMPVMYHVITEITTLHSGIDIRRIMDPLASITVAVFLFGTTFTWGNGMQTSKRSLGMKLGKKHPQAPRKVTFFKEMLHYIKNATLT